MKVAGAIAVGIRPIIFAGKDFVKLQVFVLLDFHLEFPYPEFIKFIAKWESPVKRKIRKHPKIVRNYGVGSAWLEDRWSETIYVSRISEGPGKIRDIGREGRFHQHSHAH